MELLNKVKEAIKLDNTDRKLDLKLNGKIETYDSKIVEEYKKDSAVWKAQWKENFRK